MGKLSTIQRIGWYYTNNWNFRGSQQSHSPLFQKIQCLHDRRFCASTGFFSYPGFYPAPLHCWIQSHCCQRYHIPFHLILQTTWKTKVNIPQLRDGSNENTIEKWTKYLNLYENKALVSDCFWFAICKFFHPSKYVYSESELEKRIAKNYIGLFLSIPDKK